MPPVLRISDESYGRLKKWAEPLKNNADAAFRKVLDAAEALRESRESGIEHVENAPSGTSTEQSVEAQYIPNSTLLKGREPAEFQYAALPEEFGSLGKRRKAMLARGAYLERIEARVERPRP